MQIDYRKNIIINTVDICVPVMQWQGDWHRSHCLLKTWIILIQVFKVLLYCCHLSQVGCRSISLLFLGWLDSRSLWALHRHQLVQILLSDGFQLAVCYLALPCWVSLVKASKTGQSVLVLRPGGSVPSPARGGAAKVVVGPSGWIATLSSSCTSSSCPTSGYIRPLWGQSRTMCPCWPHP